MDDDANLPATRPEFRTLSEDDVWEALVGDAFADTAIAVEVTRLMAIYATLLNACTDRRGGAAHKRPKWPIERVALVMLAHAVDTELAPRQDELREQRKRPRTPLRLSRDDEAQLQLWSTHRSALLRQRAAIILAWSQTADSDYIAKICDASLSSVYKWRTVFLKHGLPGLLAGI